MLKVTDWVLVRLRDNRLFAMLVHGVLFGGLLSWI